MSEVNATQTKNTEKAYWGKEKRLKFSFDKKKKSFKFDLPTKF